MLKVQPLRIIKRGGLYIPAMTIVMVVVTLIVMHAISTFRNLDHHQRQWEHFLEKNGRDIISIIKVELEGGRLKDPLSSKDLKELLKRMVTNLDIAYIGLLDEKGQWTVEDQSTEGGSYFQGKEGDWDGKEERKSFRRVKKLADGRRILEIGEFLNATHIQTAAVGLWMTPLDEARDQDLRHALLMGGILLILGSTAFYFIFVVQNYYLIDRTLDEMKSYTENVVESMVNGLITVDKMGRIVSINPAASSMLGLERKAFLRSPLNDVIPPQCLDIDEVIRHRSSIIEKEIDCPRGQVEIPLNISVAPLQGPEGSHTGAVIILRDLREIRDLQEKVRRSERLASLGRLASGMAHEIRNPLSSIKGFAQYFRDKFETGTEDKSYAEIVIQEVERLNRVITQLLDFAKPKELHLQMNPLSQILEHPLKLIQADLKKKGIRLVVPSFPGEKINVDSDQITQAFLNIFLNAMESMGDGGELRLETFLRPEKNRVEIRVSDTGPGISQENLSRIFDPFFSTKKKGAGLGLAITATIIAAHGGEITVESKEGKGTTFKIYLPFYKP